MTKLKIGEPNRETATCQSPDTQHNLSFVRSSTDNPESNPHVTKTGIRYTTKASVSPVSYIRQFKDVPGKKVSTIEIKTVRQIAKPQVTKIEVFAT